jgi:allantoinase
LIVRNGWLALPGERDFWKLDFKVSGGKIVAIGASLPAEAGEETLDAEGLRVFPGAIDPHVHFDEPGFTEREDFAHGTAAAAKGGVTTVIDMPCTSLPPVTDLSALERKLEAIAPKAVVDYALFGGVSGHLVEEALARDMAELAPRVVGFKCYFVSGMATFTAVTHDDFARIASLAAALGRPLLLHAEDASYVEGATRRLKAAAPKGTWREYRDSRPEAAEILAVAAAAELSGIHSRWVHIVHVGSSEAAWIARESGMSAETCPHYLAFSSDDFEAKGAALKTAPVVKRKGEADALWAMLAGGDLSFVASDHAPARPEEKRVEDFWQAYGGIPGTGTMVPYLLSEGLMRGRLPLPRFLEATSSAAAARYGLDRAKGAIAVGRDADFYLFDPDAETVVDGKKLKSKGSDTPFDGMRLSGAIVATYVRGELVHDGASDETKAEPGFGKNLAWGCE